MTPPHHLTPLHHSQTQNVFPGLYTFSSTMTYVVSYSQLLLAWIKVLLPPPTPWVWVTTFLPNLHV
jgi:hypothetical protein